MPSYPTAREWLSDNGNNIDAVILDIDGVILKEKRPIPGAGRFLEQLQENGIPYRFLTNDACNPLLEKVSSLSSIGANIKEENITSSGHGIMDVVSSKDLRGKKFLVLGLLGDPEYGKLAGLATTRRLEDLHSCNGIIIGEGHYDWETSFVAAVNFYIRHPEAPLIVPNPDWYYAVEDGSIRLASGPAAHVIQQTLALHGEYVDPIFTGKPYRPIFAHNHGKLQEQHGKIPQDRVLMIGDSLTSDIAGAAQFGYQTALTLTGISTEKMIGKVGQAPDMVFRSIESI